MSSPRILSKNNKILRSRLFEFVFFLVEKRNKCYKMTFFEFFLHQKRKRGETNVF